MYRNKMRKTDNGCLVDNILYISRDKMRKRDNGCLVATFYTFLQGQNEENRQ